MYRIAAAAFAAITFAVPASAETVRVPVSAPFTNIVSLGSDRLVIRQGAEPGIRMEGDRTDLDRMVLTNSGNTLSITRRGQGNDHSRGVTVTIVMSRLDKVTLRGSGSAAVLRIEQRAMGADLVGSGSLSLDHVRIGSLALALRGSGSIDATGSAEQTTVALLGSGGASLAGLETRDLVIANQGSGSIRAAATDTATIDSAGSGAVSVSGTARCVVNAHGSGGVRCGR